MENNSRKQILFLTSWYPDRVTLDNGDFIQRHAKAIALKHDVTVVYAVKDPQLKHKKIEIVEYQYNGLKEIIVYVRPSFFSPFNLIRLLEGYRLGCKGVSNFDIIHLNVTYPAGLVALFLKKKFNRPLILTEHWTYLHKNNFEKLPRYKQFFIRKILNHIDIVLPVSKHLGESLRHINSSLTYHVIPNVVDVEKFKIIQKTNHRKRRFLHLSHLGDEHKNISGMLRVAKRLVEEGYDFAFEIGGNGNITPINLFIKENELEQNVFTFGRLEHHEVNQKLNESDCFVLFSRYENQPCVQIEAFACGLPIIATNVGGVKEYLPTGFGILIDSENEEQLYQAMIDVINGKQFSSKKQMHQFAEAHFSKRIIAEEFDAIYNRF